MSRGKKIAEQIIDKYCIKNPRDLNLEEIANAEGLIIEESNISGSLGKIIFNDDYGLILINKSINNEELNVMKRFLKGTENLLGKSNGGIKEYFFE